MSEDSTWLKKNSANYPLKRELKASLMFHVPNQEMNASIISNPEKANKPDLFIPRMLQKRSAQMRMSRAHQFKVPQFTVSKKKDDEKELNNMPRKSLAPGKSLLPVPTSKSQPPAKEAAVKSSLSRPSFMPGASVRRSSVKRKLIQRMMELSEEKKNPDLKLPSSDHSVIRSILKKKRASLRKSQVSSSKPKGKRVLFDGIGSFVEEKENCPEPSPMKTDETEPPALFDSTDSPCAGSSSQIMSVESEENELKVPDSITVNSVLKIFNSFKDKMNNLQRVQVGLENSVDSLLRHTVLVQDECKSLKKDFEDICVSMGKLSEELEGKLKEIIHGNCSDTTTTESRKRRSLERKKPDKLRLSDKSKAIKGNLKKRGSLAVREILKDVDETCKFISWKNDD